MWLSPRKYWLRLRTGAIFWYIRVGRYDKFPAVVRPLVWIKRIQFISFFLFFFNPCPCLYFLRLRISAFSLSLCIFITWPAYPAAAYTICANAATLSFYFRVGYDRGIHEHQVAKVQLHVLCCWGNISRNSSFCYTIYMYRAGFDAAFLFKIR